MVSRKLSFSFAAFSSSFIRNTNAHLPRQARDTTCHKEKSPNKVTCFSQTKRRALNDTRDWADLGTLHPRMKKPLGKRLAAGLHATAYNGSGPVGGPVLVGCSVDAAKKTLTIKFDSAVRKQLVSF